MGRMCSNSFVHIFTDKLNEPWEHCNPPLAKFDLMKQEYAQIVLPSSSYEARMRANPKYIGPGYPNAVAQNHSGRRGWDVEGVAQTGKGYGGAAQTEEEHMRRRRRRASPATFRCGGTFIHSQPDSGSLPWGEEETNCWEGVFGSWWRLGPSQLNSTQLHSTPKGRRKEEGEQAAAARPSTSRSTCLPTNQPRTFLTDRRWHVKSWTAVDTDISHSEMAGVIDWCCKPKRADSRLFASLKEGRDRPISITFANTQKHLKSIHDRRRLLQFEMAE